MTMLAGGTGVSMLRLIIAGLITLTLIPAAAAILDDDDSLGQFVAIMGILIAISLVLPHYFYRGEPLLPDRRKRR
jgi:hypothetical protein